MATPTTTTYAVTGMTCGNCVKHITSEFLEVDGVQNVDVDLNVRGASKVTVTSTAPIPHDVAVQAIDEAGYALQA